MQYVIKEKFWSWGDDFHIYTPDHSPVFFRDGQAFSWGDKLSFQDMDGNELAFMNSTHWKSPAFTAYWYDDTAVVTSGITGRRPMISLPPRSIRRTSDNQ
jgi:hypothetical protein